MADHIFTEDEAGNLTFVGDFDGLYRDVADPWGQSGEREDNADYYRMSRGRLASALAQLLPSRGRRIEIGCGHGWTLPQLQAVTGEKWEGMDICQAAIDRARELHPGFAFRAGNVMEGTAFLPSLNARFDCVVLSQLLWYVLPRLDMAISNAVRILDVGGILAVSQAFLREQKYGRETIDGFQGALRYFISRGNLALIEARHEDSGEYPFNDGLLILRKLRHAQ